MKAWLRVLKDAGVNLQKYGEREAELFNSEIHERNFPSYSVSHGGEICWNDYLRLDLVLVVYRVQMTLSDRPRSSRLGKMILTNERLPFTSGSGVTSQL